MKMCKGPIRLEHSVHMHMYGMYMNVYVCVMSVCFLLLGLLYC